MELIDYRSLIKNSFYQHISKQEPLTDLIKKTNEIFLKSKVHPILKTKKEIYSIQYTITEENSNKLLAILAIEVINLLNSKDGMYVKKCNNHTCSLLFVDTSKNHSRRWCSMETCGNRKKASKFSKRQKELQNQ